MINMGPTVSETKLARVTSLFLKNRRQPGKNWWWPLNELNGALASKKQANKFLLCSILDFQMKSEKALENGKKLSEDLLGDPNDLWKVISSFSKNEWDLKFKDYHLHRFKWAHNRVWRIANDIIKYYDGDSRQIWVGKSTDEAISGFNKIRIGENISRMCVGALIDTKQMSGKGNVKADIHLMRVLGRVLIGKKLSEHEVIAYTDEMYPKNPWLLDREFWSIGKELCRPDNPKCNLCYLRTECTYSRN